MRKHVLIRILLWIIAGTAFGFLLISPMGENWLRRFPLFGEIINVLLLPATWLTSFWAAMGLGPHGDAGFGVMLIFMVGIWSIYGLLLGLLLESVRRRRKTRMPTQMAYQERQNFGCFVKRHKTLCAGAALLLAAVCCYCVAKHFSLSQDRKFFVERINHKAVAEACLDILTQPDKYSLSIGSPLERDPMHNPNLPEVIRQLQPSFVCVRGAEASASVMITKNNYTYLLFEHPFGNLKSFDLVYQEGPSSNDRRTILYTINASTSHETNQDSRNSNH
jgi:hypothetical protein